MFKPFWPKLRIFPGRKRRPQQTDKEFRFWIDFVYRHCLGRAPDPIGLKGYLAALRDGMSFSALVQDVDSSEEARQRRSKPGLMGPLDDLSDGEFILNIAELLFLERGLTPKSLEHWKAFLGEDRARRHALVQQLIEDHVRSRGRHAGPRHDPSNCLIMGTGEYLSPAIWEKRARELNLKWLPRSARRKIAAKFSHSGEYKISAIASLYKGRRYIESFLENITSQTIFDRSELIIIDANSPEGEEEIIAEYQKRYDNIVYKRINHRIGVYDAWNIGIELARGDYLTNTNLDDLRRSDSFELQAATLDRHAFADVVYQDFYYSFDPALSFEEVAAFGFKSDLPIITPQNLLLFNSPHNAPMWRKRLHDELGLFDTSFLSAGDYELWMRCISRGKQFLKINTPHVVYFQNPEGISTKRDTLGIEEGRRLLRRYSRELISPIALRSRETFARLLGTQADWDGNLTYYDVVRRELLRLGEEHKRSERICPIRIKADRLGALAG